MPQSSILPFPQVAIVGGGPAGLMAAEVLSQAGVRTEVFDAMPSVGRKFLLAGVGGMNITHAEAREQFLGRYGRRQKEIAALLGEFDADALRAWIHGLGIDTFVGSSGRVFPSDMKAAPLLRAWLKRLREQGVLIHTRCRWLGWNADGTLDIQSAAERLSIRADAVILALGGGSWQRLGSDGAWVPLLRARGIEVEPLRPSNCGFEIDGWSELFRDKFSGAPVKPVAMGLAGETPRQGEFVVTRDGIEGSLVYASPPPSANGSRHGARPKYGWTCRRTGVASRSRQPWLARAVPGRWPITCAASWASMGFGPASCVNSPPPPPIPSRPAWRRRSSACR